MTDPASLTGWALIKIVAGLLGVGTAASWLVLDVMVGEVPLPTETRPEKSVQQQSQPYSQPNNQQYNRSQTSPPATPREAPSSSYNEPRVRYILVDMALGGPVSYYRGYVDSDPHAAEAVRRYDAGVRATNSNEFERIRINGSPVIVYGGTSSQINGMDVGLSD